MARIRVAWFRRIADTEPGSIRSMTQEFSSAKRAAEYAADIEYMLAQPDRTVPASADKWYVVSKSKPRASWESADKNMWLTVEWLP